MIQRGIRPAQVPPWGSSMICVLCGFHFKAGPLVARLGVAFAIINPLKCGHIAFRTDDPPLQV